jgi:MFS superfamily sulfate permease-like transporter
MSGTTQLGQKLHEEPEQIVIFEGSSPETFLLGSGLTRSREEQMQVLARNAARRVQLWMLQNPEWFNIDPDAAEAAAAEVEQIAEAVRNAHRRGCRRRGCRRGGLRADRGHPLSRTGGRGVVQLTA